MKLILSATACASLLLCSNLWGSSTQQALLNSAVCGGACAGYEFLTEVQQLAPGKYELRFIVTDRNALSSSAHFRSFSVSAFNGSVDAELQSVMFNGVQQSRSLWWVADNAGGNPGNDGCGKAREPGSLCVSFNDPTQRNSSENLLDGPGESLSFDFTVFGAIALGVDPTWHLMANAAKANGHGNAFAINRDVRPITLDGPPAPPPRGPVPEPPTLILLFAGTLLWLARLGRRRRDVFDYYAGH